MLTLMVRSFVAATLFTLGGGQPILAEESGADIAHNEPVFGFNEILPSIDVDEATLSKVEALAGQHVERQYEEEINDVLYPVRRSWKNQPVIDGDAWLVQNPEFVWDLFRTAAPVHLVLLFASGSDSCKVISSSLGQAAKAYWDDMERRRSVSTSKLFFMSFNASKATSSKVFREFKISKVPTVVYIPKDVNVLEDGLDEGWVKDPSIFQVEDVISWLEGQMGPNIRLPRPIKIDLVGNTANFIENWGFYIIGLQLMVIFASNAYRFTSKNAWMILSIGVYFFSISGCIFCFLRGASPFGYSEQHGLMFLYPDRSGQFFFEGLVIGIINLCISISLVFAGYFVQGVDIFALLEEYVDGVSPSQIREPRIKFVERLTRTASICIAVGIIFLLNLWVIFKRKAPWYSPFFW